MIPAEARDRKYKCFQEGTRGQRTQGVIKTSLGFGWDRLFVLRFPSLLPRARLYPIFDWWSCQFHIQYLFSSLFIYCILTLNFSSPVGSEPRYLPLPLLPPCISLVLCSLNATSQASSHRTRFWWHSFGWSSTVLLPLQTHFWWCHRGSARTSFPVPTTFYCLPCQAAPKECQRAAGHFIVWPCRWSWKAGSRRSFQVQSSTATKFYSALRSSSSSHRSSWLGSSSPVLSVFRNVWTQSPGEWNWRNRLHLLVWLSFILSSAWKCHGR